jgi:methoxymalonate biosynthesis acyl carrier protein
VSKVTAGEVAQDLETFVRERFQVEEDDDFFTTDVNLWEEGYVDSAGVVELIAYLEDSYTIQIPRSMLFDPGFTSVDGIAERVVRLL